MGCVRETQEKDHRPHPAYMEPEWRNRPEMSKQKLQTVINFTMETQKVIKLVLLKELRGGAVREGFSVAVTPSGFPDAQIIVSQVFSNN